MNTTQKPIESGFIAKSDPDDILAGIDLSGKNALVTGGYSGIGLETVRALKKAGAKVAVPARDVARAQTALADILDADDILPMDLSDLHSVGAFTKAYQARCESLDILIANAGVMACPQDYTAQNLEWQIGVNHFGHFALIHGVLPLLEAAPHARIVMLSSIAHRMSPIRWDDMHYRNGDYEKWQSYGQSKTAVSLLAVECDRRFQDKNIRAFAVHPGGIFTPLQRHLGNEEMVALGWTKEDGSPSDGAAAIFKTPRQGATTSLWCATSPQLDGKGGVYCEDCDIAEAVAEDDAGFTGVRPWAVDAKQAEKLWHETEQQFQELGIAL